VHGWLKREQGSPIPSGELGDLGREIGERVDVAEAGGLEQAAGVDVVLAEQIRDGAGDPARGRRASRRSRRSSR
jgi:hypothetical protein